MHIEEARPDDPRLLDLIARHKTFATENSPPDACYAVAPGTSDMDGIDYWLAFEGALTMGCVGLKSLSIDTAELKTMHVRETYRGQGVASALVDALEHKARRDGVTQLFLETGQSEGFAASRHFYEKAGFTACARYGQYVGNAFSYCMMKTL